MEATTPRNTPFPPGNGGADGPLDKASLSAHAAVNSVAGVADDAARKIKPVIDKVAAMAHQAVDKAAGTAAPTADWLAEQGDRLAEQGDRLNATQKKLAADTCSYVSANPLKSVGIAVVAGFLLSRIFRL